MYPDPAMRPPGNAARRFVVGLGLAAVLGSVVAGSGASALRIVGGKSIEATAAPWAVFVMVGSGSSADRCTGVIIDASHVLVAGHCVYRNNRLAALAQITVRAGISNSNAPVSSQEQDRTVSAYRVPPGFRNTGLDVPDDVAVLTLAMPLALNTPYVQATALPAANAPFPGGAEVVIAGFGRTVGKGLTAGPLKEMTAIVERQGNCGAFGNASFYFDADGVFICAYTPVAAACGGDSGDGFVTTGHRVVLGVLEDASPGCAPRSMEIGAYVGAPEILDFIQGNNRPPVAPRLTRATSVELRAPATPAVGSTLRCAATGWSPPVRISYSYLDVSTGQILKGNSGQVLRVPPQAAGTSILCQVAVTNAGGTLVADSTQTVRVQPAP